MKAIDYFRRSIHTRAHDRDTSMTIHLLAWLAAKG
jgi:hypothetical protein